MKEIEKQMKALANKRRLYILKNLKSADKLSVGEIAKKINLSFKATSKHLCILYSAEILEREQESLTTFYRLSPNIKSIVRGVISFL